MADKTGKICIFEKCTELQRLKINGKCEDCGAHKRSQDLGKKCGPNDCKE